MTTLCSGEDQPQATGGPIIPSFPLKPVTTVQGATGLLGYLKQMCYQEWINIRLIHITPAHTPFFWRDSISSPSSKIESYLLPSRYTLIPPPPIPPHPDRETVKAVDKRARVLTEEYRKKARDVDRVYGGL